MCTELQKCARLCVMQKGRDESTGLMPAIEGGQEVWTSVRFLLCLWWLVRVQAVSR